MADERTPLFESPPANQETPTGSPPRGATTPMPSRPTTTFSTPARTIPVPRSDREHRTKKQHQKPKFDFLFVKRLWNLVVLAASRSRMALIPRYLLILGLAVSSELLDLLAATRRAQFYLYLPAGELKQFYACAMELSALYLLHAVIKGTRKFVVGVMRVELGRGLIRSMQRRVLDEDDEDEERKGERMGRERRDSGSSSSGMDDEHLVYHRMFRRAAEPLQRLSRSPSNLEEGGESTTQPRETGVVSMRTETGRVEVATVIDNPDQRMTNDVRELFLYLAGLVDSLAILPFVLAYYFYLLVLEIPASALLRFGIFWIFVLIAVFLTYLPLVNVIVHREERSGELRWLHVRLREEVARSVANKGRNKHAEPILPEERRDLLDEALDTLVEWQMKYVGWTSFQSTVVSMVDGLKYVAVYVVISLSIFPIKGKLPPDLASRIHFLAYLLEHTGNRLMVLVDHMGSLSELAGYVARVAGVLDVIGWDRLPAT